MISPNDFFVWSNIFGCVSIHPIWAWIPKNVVLYQSNQCLFCWYLIWTSSNLCGSLTINSQAEKFWSSLYIDISKRLLHLTIHFWLCLYPSYMSLDAKECCLTSKWSVFILLVFDMDFGQSLRFFNIPQSRLKNFDRLCTLIFPNDFFVWSYVFGCVSIYPIWAWIPKNVV